MSIKLGNSHVLSKEPCGKTRAYNKVGAILDGNEELRERYEPEVPHLEELHKMYKVLKKTRDERGAIEFETVVRLLMG